MRVPQLWVCNWSLQKSKIKKSAFFQLSQLFKPVLYYIRSTKILTILNSKWDHLVNYICKIVSKYLFPN